MTQYLGIDVYLESDANKSGDVDRDDTSSQATNRATTIPIFICETLMFHELGRMKFYDSWKSHMGWIPKTTDQATPDK